MEEGYGFTLYDNKSKESTLNEKVNYTTFEGLQLMKPFKDQSYEVAVAAGQRQIVIIRQMDPYGYAMSSSTSNSIGFSSLHLKELCKQQGKLTKRVNPQNKQELEIYQYQFKHSSGICYLYENNTPNKRFEEQLKFTLEGLEIVGQPSNNVVQIKLKPGES